jgi:ribosomal protein S18 acetylase RimI-like enzyme
MQLDNPVWWALSGPQRSLGAARSRSARFAAAVSPFGGFEGAPEPNDWEALAELSGPGATVAVIADDEDHLVPPDGWTISWAGAGVQMVRATAVAESRVEGRPNDDVVPLSTGDVDEMLALVAESRPGPFGSRTVEFGGYVGIRRGGRLVAMAGERLRPPGYAEISAVTTHPDHRRQGLAERLVGVVAAGIAARGETPFLHAAADNASAIRLYRTMGFVVRRTVWFSALQVPESEAQHESAS